jgi:hypothetical protein
MRMVTIEPGGVFGLCTTMSTGPASSTFCKAPSPTIETNGHDYGRVWLA